METPREWTEEECDAEQAIARAADAWTEMVCAMQAIPADRRAAFLVEVGLWDETSQQAIVAEAAELDAEDAADAESEGDPR